MTVRIDENALTFTKFAVGQPVPRSEDPLLLRGEGRYTDDVSIAGQLYAAVVRSPYAHGLIRSVETADARAMPGVVAVYTAQDLGDYGALKCGLPFVSADGTPMRKPARPAFATDKVRFVGDPLAVVIAKTPDQAQNAAEAVAFDIEQLPAVVDAAEAIKDGAPQLYDDVPNNLALDYVFGDARAVEAAFAKAAHVTRLHLINNRVVVNAMEPRAALVDYDGTSGRFTMHVGSQGVFGMRAGIADVLGLPVDRVRIITGHVGGSFGMKGSVFPEYVAFLHAARDLNKPIKWTETRSGSFVSDHHGRDHDMVAELALDRRGRFLAVRVEGYGNLGAYLTGFGVMTSTLNVGKNMASVYKTPLMYVRSRSVFTNTPPIGAYRGAGRPEGNYYMERLIHTAAMEMGIDPADLRRRNHIEATSLPYKAVSEMTYDSGEFTAILDKALALADWNGFKARKAESRKRGKLRGRGIGQYLEVTAPPMREMGGLRFEKDGTVTIITGTLDYGQGHATPFAQVLSQRLGVPFEAIRLVQGDSDRLIAGGGTGGSKSIMASGAAILGASDIVIERGRAVAAHVLEAGVADIEFEAGQFRIAGTDRAIGIMDLARRLNDGIAGLPADLPGTLDVDHIHEASPSAFPNGCHIAEVEVDPETGHVDVVRYTMVNDFGTVVNPMLVEGQLHGGVMQGIGQALMERTAYDGDGQLMTGSFMDYALPRADATPDFHFASHAVPTSTNPLGAKGCGEAGCAGSLPSVMNALVDALSGHGVTHIDMPATPEKVWAAIHARA
jgi:carbon-monoxide dehydrogenase large subunit